MHLFVIESVSQLTFKYFFGSSLIIFCQSSANCYLKWKGCYERHFELQISLYTRFIFVYTPESKTAFICIFYFWFFDSFYNYLFTFHFYKDGQVLLRETTHIKKKQFLRWILWLGLVLYFNKYNFDHSCILLEPSYFRIPNSNVNFIKNHLHTNSQIVCEVSLTESVK